MLATINVFDVHEFYTLQITAEFCLWDMMPCTAAVENHLFTRLHGITSRMKELSGGLVVTFLVWLEGKGKGKSKVVPVLN
jgi:hypothetical protein